MGAIDYSEFRGDASANKNQLVDYVGISEILKSKLIDVNENVDTLFIVGRHLFQQIWLKYINLKPVSLNKMIFMPRSLRVSVII